MTIFRAPLAGAVLACAALLPSAGSAEVNVYTYREPPLIQPLFDRFTKETGIKVNVIFATKGLEERIKAEGVASPADLFVAADAALLVKAADMGLLQKTVTPAVAAAVPEQFRDPAGLWTGLTYRARVIYASKARVTETSFTYEDLADPKWKGKVCTRSGQHPYNIALTAGMIVRDGADKTEAWLAGVKANLAVKPSGNDRSQMKSIMSGECDLAVGNTYYYGLMATNDKEPEQKDWAASARIVFPTYRGGGTHVNISGVGLTVNAPNTADALKLVDFMVSEAAQHAYADLNFEYPVRAGVAVAPLIRDLGSFTPDKASLVDMSQKRAQASELVDKVRFDN